jgi:hypothetical protein
MTMFSGVVENNVMVTYPVSLHTRGKTGGMNWLGFLYTFLYTGKDGEKVATISYPLCFDNEHKTEIYTRLLTEVEELATAFKASRTEYTGYANCSQEVDPVSDMVCGNVVNEDFLTFIKNEFTEKGVYYCYEVVPISGEPENVYTISDFNMRRRKYLELLHGSDSFVQKFDLETFLREPPGILEKFYFEKEWVIFAESENERGCCRWVPSFRNITSAHVVRLILEGSPAYVAQTIPDMLKMIGLYANTVYIGSIKNKSAEEQAIKEMGGKKVYETVSMVKYY